MNGKNAGGIRVLQVIFITLLLLVRPDISGAVVLQADRGAVPVFYNATGEEGENQEKAGESYYCPLRVFFPQPSCLALVPLFAKILLPDVRYSFPASGMHSRQTYIWYCVYLI